MPVRTFDPELLELLTRPIEASAAPAEPAPLPAPEAWEPQARAASAAEVAAPPPAAGWSLPIAVPNLARAAYRRVGTTIAFLGAAGIGALIWYFGGVFTLDFLADTVPSLAAWMAAAPVWQVWSIPVAVSAMELFLWPRRERRLVVLGIRLSLWLAVLVFDVLTTHRGVLPVISRQLIPMPLSEPWRLGIDHGVSLLLGGAFAYLPEKIARWVLGDLWALWVAPIGRMLRRGLDRRARSA